MARTADQKGRVFDRQSRVGEIQLGNQSGATRHCDPIGIEKRWPEDTGNFYEDCVIYCGAMFDLRKGLIDLLGPEAGAIKSNELFFDSSRTLRDIPTTFVELLAADDDDANLANGTPNGCLIQEAFAVTAWPIRTTSLRYRPSPRAQRRLATVCGHAHSLQSERGPRRKKRGPCEPALTASRSSGCQRSVMFAAFMTTKTGLVVRPRRTLQHRVKAPLAQARALNVIDVTHYRIGILPEPCLLSPNAGTGHGERGEH